MPMAATSNKQKVLNEVFSSLKKAHEPKEQEARPVLEQFIYAICYEDASRDQADRAFANLKGRFFDWNEIRVSSAREIEEAIADLPDAEARAQRLLSFLQEVFETTYSFELESLHKKKGGVKQAAQLLSRYQAATDFIVSWVIQHSLGGHAIPLDEPTIRTAARLGFIDPEHSEKSSAQSSLEHLVPKAKGPQFTEVIKHIGTDFCFDQEPDCPACPLSSSCPTAQAVPRATVGGERKRK